ncbi:MAG TPA: hypothetical protein VKD91_04045 [Pyrinomonadaceae bacterium]|nr:hypothetical protein [Pyrinomonadaceae bacterium]
MEDESFELKEKISQIPDEELLRMFGADAGQYRQEAIALAKFEIARRGLAFDSQSSGVRCSKCAGAMEEGFVADHSLPGTTQPMTWVEGRPENSFWEGVKVVDRRTLRITVYRCAACGYLEFYASEE